MTNSDQPRDRMTWEEKRQVRLDRYQARADRQASESSRLWDRAQRMASVIPMGQPILIGHHSEQRHRNYLKRIDRVSDRAMAAHKAAEYWRSRAASAESSHAISSDDENALDKLRAKLADMEDQQSHMKTVNQAWRRAGKPKHTDADAWAKLGQACNLSGEQVAELIHRIALTPYYPMPYPPYAMSNNNANMARVKGRIAELERAARQETKSRAFAGFELVENVEANRIQFIFPGKPPAEVRSLLKSHGFRWAPSEGAWQRHLNGSGKLNAQWVAEKLPALLATEG